jgi:hypothetical protein
LDNKQYFKLIKKKDILKRLGKKWLKKELYLLVEWVLEWVH